MQLSANRQGCEMLIPRALLRRISQTLFKARTHELMARPVGSLVLPAAIARYAARCARHQGLVVAHAVATRDGRRFVVGPSGVELGRITGNAAGGSVFCHDVVSRRKRLG